MSKGQLFVSRRDVMACGMAIGGLAIAGYSSARSTSAVSVEKLPDAESWGQHIWRVDHAGYRAEEFLLSGSAPLYHPVSSADVPIGVVRDETADRSRRTFELTRLGPAAPYVTRVVVYRPIDPDRFSGNVVLESFHYSDGGSMVVMKKLNRFFTRNGDIIVGVQHQQTLENLRELDPKRYGSVRVSHGSQLWAMLRDTGAQLRVDGPDNLVGGLHVRRLFMTGHSHTGNIAGVFANFHHHDARQSNGRPIFDGYLPLGTATYVRPLDVPVMKVNVESDFAARNGLGNRAVDEPGRDLYRLYEIPGPSHVNAPIWKGANDAEPPVRGNPTPGWYDWDRKCQETFGKDTWKNDFPTHIAYAAIFRNMYDWVERDVVAPPSMLIATRSNAEEDYLNAAARDRFGNARGGLRLPHIDVPIARYGVGSNEECRQTGYTRPFDAEMLKQLYGDRDRWKAKFNAATKAAIAARMVLPEDSPEIQAFVDDAPNF